MRNRRMDFSIYFCYVLLIVSPFCGFAEVGSSVVASDLSLGLSLGSTPSSIQSVMPQIRTAIYDLDSDHQLLIIGIDQTGKDYAGVDLTRFPYSTLGFRSTDGQKINLVSPMYLVEISKKVGINSIYDFNDNFWINDFTKLNPGLPPKLMSIPDARLGLAEQGLIKIGHTALLFSPVAILGNILGTVAAVSERQDIGKATWFMRILEQAKQGQIDNNAKVFGSLNLGQVDQILAALRLRFNEDSPYSGLLVSNKKRVQFLMSIIRKNLA